MSLLQALKDKIAELEDRAVEFEHVIAQEIASVLGSKADGPAGLLQDIPYTPGVDAVIAQPTLGADVPAKEDEEAKDEEPETETGLNTEPYKFDATGVVTPPADPVPEPVVEQPVVEQAAPAPEVAADPTVVEEAKKAE